MILTAETVWNLNHYNSAEGSHIQKSGLYLVFNVTAAYKKPCNRTEKRSAVNRIIMRNVAGCTKVLKPLSKTPRDNWSICGQHTSLFRQGGFCFVQRHDDRWSRYWPEKQEATLYIAAWLQLVEKIDNCSRSELLLSVFCPGSPGAKNTSISASVLETASPYSLRAQLAFYRR